jgi:hypothetical protein
MTLTLPQEQVDALAAALQAPSRSAGGAARLMRSIADEGWMAAWRLDDVLHITDRRLIPHEHGIDLETIAAALDLRPVHVTHRPRARSNGAMLQQAWSAWDAVALFIWLEELGFTIDPSPLVEHLLPLVPKRGLITASQLAVLWYGKTRGKGRVEIAAEGRPAPRDVVRSKLVSGHNVDIWRDLDGRTIRLCVEGPKHRERRPPVETRCPDCDYVWYRGDPDSSAIHRREHKARMVFLDPQPDPEMLAARAADDNPEIVTWRSPSWKQRAMDDRALIFRREMHYSFVGWGAQAENDRTAEGYLFTDPAGAIVGACTFRWREYANAPAAWALQWVWVCPKARRQGVLRARWPRFRERYGDFHIEPPVSPAMQAFVRAMGDAAMLGPQDPDLVQS